MTSIRENPLVNNHFYHIYTRSIAGFVVFNNEFEYFRMEDLLNLYKYKDFNYKYSVFNDLEFKTQESIKSFLKNQNNALVDVIAYCLMPTHIHLLLKQIEDNGISKFMNTTLNSYSRYFNLRHKRQGPLWSERFKSVLVNNDEQLLHLTRYIHLNPTSANLVKKPQDWQNSSYKNYLDEEGMLTSNDIFSLNSKEYEKFVLDRQSYQRELALIKNLLIDDYSG